MELGALEALAAAGDVGIWGLLAVLWRFDRRLLTLEHGFKSLREVWATFGPHFPKATASNGNQCQ